MSDFASLYDDVEARLLQLEQLIAEAKAVPLSASIMVNRAEVEGLLGDIRESFPEELHQARWIMQERDAILEDAQQEAEQILEDAQTEEARLIAKTEVMQSANREADRVIDEAYEQSRQIRLEAEDYVDARLASFEVVLQRTLTAVERGRERLRWRLGEPDDFYDEFGLGGG